MANRATFTLDKEAYSFLMSVGGDNRSAFINQLLKEEKQRTLKQAILRANGEEAEDADYKAELEAWDNTLMDGLQND